MNPWTASKWIVDSGVLLFYSIQYMIFKPILHRFVNVIF